MEREWREIEGYEGLYEVSNDGLVMSHDRETLCSNGKVRRTKGRILSSKPNPAGYIMATLYDEDSVPTPHQVHILVLEAFIGPRPEGLTCNHKDGVKTNNHVDNLEWITLSENLKHAFRLGLVSRVGVKNPNAKLTENNIREIWYLKANGYKPKQIAELYGITRGHVYKICRAAAWDHVKAWRSGE